MLDEPKENTSEPQKEDGLNPLGNDSGMPEKTEEEQVSTKKLGRKKGRSTKSLTLVLDKLHEVIELIEDRSLEEGSSEEGSSEEGSSEEGSSEEGNLRDTDLDESNKEFFEKVRTPTYFVPDLFQERKAELELFLDEQELNLNVLSDTRVEFVKWKDYVLHISNNIDDLLYEFSEVIEKYSIRYRKIAVFPIDLKNKKKSVSVLKEMAIGLNDLDESGLPDRLNQIQGLSLRGVTELDYFIGEDVITIESRAYAKEVLNTVVLLYKKLNGVYKELNVILAWIAKEEEPIYRGIHSKPSIIILDENIGLAQEEDFKNKMITAVKHDKKMLVDCRKLSEKIKKDYFKSILCNTILSVTSGVFESEKQFDINYKKANYQGKDSMYFDNWKQIYKKLLDLMYDFLGKIDIELIECERGDKYDEKIHNPYTQSEPDDELENEQIKEVIRLGFKYGDEVVKEVDVLVVKNENG